MFAIIAGLFAGAWVSLALELAMILFWYGVYFVGPVLIVSATMPDLAKRPELLEAMHVDVYTFSNALSQGQLPIKFIWKDEFRAAFASLLFWLAKPASQVAIGYLAYAFATTVAGEISKDFSRLGMLIGFIVLIGLWYLIIGMVDARNLAAGIVFILGILALHNDFNLLEKLLKKLGYDG
jgi:hypothetical protein